MLIRAPLRTWDVRKGVGLAWMESAQKCFCLFLQPVFAAARVDPGIHKAEQPTAPGYPAKKGSPLRLVPKLSSRDLRLIPQTLLNIPVEQNRPVSCRKICD